MPIFYPCGAAPRGGGGAPPTTLILLRNQRTPPRARPARLQVTRETGERGGAGEARGPGRAGGPEDQAATRRGVSGARGGRGPEDQERGGGRRGGPGRVLGVTPCPGYCSPTVVDCIHLNP